MSTTRTGKAFRDALREFCYVEGTNILIDDRLVVGKQETIPGIVTELVQLKPDVLVVESLTSIRAAKKATTTIPIVMSTSGDPVATGVIDSLARPGGNITGVTKMTRELNGKRVELLKEVVPTVSQLGVIWDPN